MLNLIRLMPAVARAQGKASRPRSNLKALLQAAANLLPALARRILRVRILRTTSRAGDQAIAGLLEEFNRTRTPFPQNRPVPRLRTT